MSDFDLRAALDECYRRGRRDGKLSAVSAAYHAAARHQDDPYQIFQEISSQYSQALVEEA